MLISREYKSEDGDTQESAMDERQHQQRLHPCRQQQPQPPHSAGSSITSPLVRGIKRQLNFDFAGEPSSPPPGISTAVCAHCDGGCYCSEHHPAAQAVAHAPVPDLGRLLENITQASIYQKRMRRRNSSGAAACPKAGPQASPCDLAMTAEPPSAPVSASCLGEAVGQAGGYKKYLRDRYLSSREDSSTGGCYGGGGGGNSSSSHPSVDLDSPDPFTPPSAPPVMAKRGGGMHGLRHQHHHHLAAGAVATALASELLQHRMCQSAPQTPQQDALASPPPALFLFPPNRRSATANTAAVYAVGATTATAAAPTTPTGRGGGHVCSVCGRTFNRSDMLNRHARLHSNTRPYECHLCPQAFSRSDHLTTHMRTHTGDKPFHCELCNYTACRRDMITRHMKIHAKHAAASVSNNSSEGSSSAGDRSPEEAGSPAATAAPPSADAV